MASQDYRLCTHLECHVRMNHPAYFAQGMDEPVEIAIRQDATDEQLADLAARFNVPIAEMKAFREARALPQASAH